MAQLKRGTRKNVRSKTPETAEAAEAAAEPAAAEPAAAEPAAAEPPAAPPADPDPVVPADPPAELEEDELQAAQGNYEKLPRSSGEEITGPVVVDRSTKPAEPPPEPVDRSNDPHWSCTRGSDGKIEWKRVDVPPPPPLPVAEAPRTRKIGDSKG